MAHSRRDFLKSLNLLFAAGLTGGLGEFFVDGKSAFAKQPTLLLGKSGQQFEVPDWTGDDFTFGHQLRNGQIPEFPKNAEAAHDFVIVGGGIAGLTTAYYLKDHDYLLLDQFEELGGQSRGSSYRGIDFSYGPLYMGDLEGLPGELVAELQLSPIKLPPERNSWYWQEKWLPGIKGDKQQTIYKEFDRLFAEAKPIWKEMDKCEGNLALLNDQLRQLDSVPFVTVLGSYDHTFIELIDQFCKSSFCGGISQLSALSGYTVLEDLANDANVFKGGNPALANALKEKLTASGKDRNNTGCFVWNIELYEDGASVVYRDKSGSLHRVNCKRIIFCAPPLVATRVIPKMDDSMKALFLSLKYGSYLVANFCMKKKIFDGSYDSWVGSPFTFTDFITAETPYIASGSYYPSMGSVMTLSNPYTAGSNGRALLLDGDREKFSTDLVGQMNNLVPQFDASLEKIVLSRWGHAMVVARPGFFQNLQKQQATNSGPCIYAHNSNYGLPWAESAIGAARRAADIALGINKKTT